MSALDCGHEPTVTDSSFTNGTAHSPDGRSMCYGCADSEQAAEVADQETKVFAAYLSGDGKNITTWTGGVLMRVTQHGTGRGGFGGEMHYIRARDVDGRNWYGKNGGTGMHIAMRRTAVSA